MRKESIFGEFIFNFLLHDRKIIIKKKKKKESEKEKKTRYYYHLH